MSTSKKANISTVTLNRNVFEHPADNIYKAISIVAKRSTQIAVDQKKELMEKLQEFESPMDILEEIFENKEQIEVSKYYEKLPKPHAIACKEWLDGKTYFRDTTDDL